MNLPKPHICPIICFIWHLHSWKFKGKCFPLIYFSRNIQLANYMYNKRKFYYSYNIVKRLNDPTYMLIISWHNTAIILSEFWSRIHMCVPIYQERCKYSICGMLEYGLSCLWCAKLDYSAFKTNCMCLPREVKS